MSDSEDKKIDIINLQKLLESTQDITNISKYPSFDIEAIENPLWNSIELQKTMIENLKDMNNSLLKTLSLKEKELTESKQSQKRSNMLSVCMLIIALISLCISIIAIVN